MSDGQLADLLCKMSPIFNGIPVLSLGRWWADNDIRVFKSGLYVGDGLVYGEPQVFKNN